ncbi:MAG: hypothetical protein WAM88_01015, partial [Nitrososphaeraceae archaeon]
GTSIYSFFPARRTGSPTTDKFKEIDSIVLSRKWIQQGVHLFNQNVVGSIPPAIFRIERNNNTTQQQGI